MIRKLSIENFRGFQHIDMNDLTRVALVSGRNNIGKSSLLEGLFLMMDHAAADSFGKLSSFRNSLVTGSTTLWGPLFLNMDTSKHIHIRFMDESKWARLEYWKDENYLPQNVNGISEDTLVQFRTALKNDYALSFSYKEGGIGRMIEDYHELCHFSLNNVGSIMREISTNLPGNEVKTQISTQYLNSVFSRSTDNLLSSIGRYELEGKKSEILDIIRELDPSIEDIITVAPQGVPQLYIKMGGKTIPLQYSGDGTIKLLNVCVAMLERENGLVLIDELETGFHYSMYGKLWNIIEKISKKSNCQVIATTHSYELISAVSENFDDKDAFSYYRMGRRNDGVTLFRYDFDLLDHALASDMEVR